MNNERALGGRVISDFEWMIGHSPEEIAAINAEAIETGRSSTEVARGQDWKKRLKTK